MIAANAPDVDVLAYVRGSFFALSFRRGITHGVPALLLLPWLVAGAVMAWDRGVRRRRDPTAAPVDFRGALLLSYLGVATHPVLDWMNTYGMRWWMPFDPSWSYGDALFIVDPWLWLLLGASVALGAERSRAASVGWIALAAAASALVLGAAFVPPAAKVLWIALVGAAIGAGARWTPVDPGARSRLARRLLGAATAYVAAMFAVHTAARGDVRSFLAAAGADAPAAILVSPLPADPLASDVIVRDGDAYRFGSHAWSAEPRARLDAGVLPELAIGPGVTVEEARAAVAAARSTRDVARYLSWSRFPHWSVEAHADGLAVRVGDARYPGIGGLSGLAVTVPR